jgi:hypothetical protein
MRSGRRRAGEMHVDDAPLAWDLHGRCAFATDFAYASDPP